MKNVVCAAFVSIVTLGNFSFANEALNTIEKQQNAGGFVTVDIQVNGLEEVSHTLSTTLDSLNSVVKELDATMRDIQASPEKLSAEQLRELTQLVQASEQFLNSSKALLISAERSFENMQAPAAAVIEDALLKTNQHLIEPTLNRVVDEVEVWRYALVGLVGLVVVLLTYLIVTSRSLVTLIAGQYRLVHVTKLGDNNP